MQKMDRRVRGIRQKVFCMIRTFFTFLCIALLVRPASAQNPGPTIQEQVSRMKQRSYVSVTSKNGNVIKGRLLSSSATAMDIQPSDKKAAPMSIAYSDIQSVQRHSLTPGKKRTLIILSVVGGILTVRGFTARRQRF